VEPGQTVAASFNTPVLFTLAEDLSKMELQVDVDEADVGKVREGQAATFTVDAYSNRRYPATIRRVGYGSQIKDGVVSYTTVLIVDNGDLSLRPGMTATAEIRTSERTDVLLVPNAALRFTPAVEDDPREPRDGLVAKLLPRLPTHRARSTDAAVDGSPQLWVLRDGQLAAVPVTAGLSDGRLTEIRGEQLQAGVQVITERLGGV
jgi:HlyD family secretion protein